MKAILRKNRITEEDIRLLDDDIIPGVSSAIEKYCGRQLLSIADLTEYYTGSGERVLQLAQYPIISVTSVNDRRNHTTYTASDYDNTLTEGVDFLVMSGPGQLHYLDGGWYKVYRYYQVVYSAGYIKANLPQDILMATKLWCAIIYSQVQSEVLGVDTHIIGDESLTYDYSAIPRKVANLLKPYKRIYGGTDKT